MSSCALSASIITTQERRFDDDNEPNRNPFDQANPHHTVYYDMKPQVDTEQADWIRVGAAWKQSNKDVLKLCLNIPDQNVPVVVRRNKSKIKLA